MTTPFTSNAKTLALFNSGIVQATFRNAMMPALGFRGEFDPRQWANQELSVIRTKSGTMSPKAKALAFKTDPTLGTYEHEQWEASIDQIADALQNDAVANDLSAINLYGKDLAALGTGAAKSILLKSRAELYNRALTGQTLITTVGSGTTKAVLKLNGLTRSFDASGRYAPVSISNPLAAYCWNGATFDAVSIIGFTPTTAGDEYGPGTVELASAYTSTSRQPIIGKTASKRVIMGGGFSVDDVGATDYLTAEGIRDAVAHLRDLGVPAFADGFYHCHVTATGMRQLKGDPNVQIMFRGQGLKPGDVSNPYVRGDLQVLEDCVIIQDAYAPQPGVIFTADQGETLAAETVNAAGTKLHTAIVCGYGKSFENWRTPLANQSQANAIARVGAWQIEQAGGATYGKADVDRVELVMRPPIDILGRVWTFAYSYTGGFETETDYLSDKPGSADVDIDGRAAYKASCAIVHVG